MSNLQFDKNVTHNGVQFLGTQIKDNQVVADGMIVDLEADTRGLKDVAESLVDRGLAHYTEKPATVSSNFVNGAQQAVSVDATAGEGATPNADGIRQRENLKPQTAPGNQPASPAAAAAATPAPTEQPQAPAHANDQPTDEEVAAAAAAAA